MSKISHVARKEVPEMSNLKNFDLKCPKLAACAGNLGHSLLKGNGTLPNG